jgi:hypothetical protein
MLNETGREIWNKAAHEFQKNNEEKKVNWWCDESKSKQRRQISGLICKDSHNVFFDKSLEFNAMRGGRFNPARSFGVLYTATCPAIASLEVLYHQFEQAFPLYKNMSKSGEKITSNFNSSIPDRQELVIVAFEIEYSRSPKLKIYSDLKSAKELTEKVGFSRYAGTSFSREFLFGNDYEISRIVGCHLHTYEKSAFKVPSARIDFETQDDLEKRNVLIPEKEIDEKIVSLTGSWIEFKYEVDMNKNEMGNHDVVCLVNGKKTNTHEFHLDPMPPKKGPHKQIHEFLPTSNASLAERKMFARYVSTQKFK